MLRAVGPTTRSSFVCAIRTVLTDGSFLMHSFKPTRTANHAEFLAAISTLQTARRQRRREPAFLLENGLLPWKSAQHSSNSAISLRVSATVLWFSIGPGTTPTLTAKPPACLDGCLRTLSESISGQNFRKVSVNLFIWLSR